jgi:predicted  nucleic acid-binding Zn-ribbon protein
MNPNEQTLVTFETRVRQMILRFQELKKENNDLRASIAKNEEAIKQLKDQVAQADQNYNALKMARMIEVSDGDLEKAKQRLSKLIRDVDKCIGIMSGEEQ